jgi:seryl-tRNA synthetase
VVDIEALERVVNKLKTKLNTLINDVLGVKHSIDNTHNYDNVNIKEELKEISDQINNVHTDINNITAKLSNMTSTTTKLALNNLTQVEINSIINENDKSHGIFAPQYILLVNKDPAKTFYKGLHLNNTSTESKSSNK